jgi:signal transduction histidine kinase
LKIRSSLYLTSLVLIVGAAVSLTLFYRQVAVQAFVRDSEADNEVLAYTSLQSLMPTLAHYLSTVAEVQLNQLSDNPLPAPLQQSIADLMKGKGAKVIEIYNRAGTMVYSSDATEIGTNHAADEGVRAALAGNTANELTYRDALSRLDRATAHDNIVQSYIPIKLPGDEHIVGVFEFCSDDNNLVDLLEQTMARVMLGGLVGFSLLYAALFAVFRRAGKVIERDQLAVEDDKRHLALVSSRVLQAEEKSKQRIAADLHEGVVQTLSAVKFSIENASARAAQGTLNIHSPTIDSMVPVIQEVIGTVSSLAAELHPASLADLGLLPALARLRDEFHRAQPSIEVEAAVQVTEHQIPQDLKITIYRTVQAFLETVGRHSDHRFVKTTLAIEKCKLRLRIDLGRSQTENDQPSSAVAIDDTYDYIDSMRERVIVSGGTCYVRADGDGQLIFLAAWPLENDNTADSSPRGRHY